MNAALKICQERFDAKLPPEVSDSDEVTDWLGHSAERLVCGVDIKWKRRYGHAGGDVRPVLHLPAGPPEPFHCCFGVGDTTTGDGDHQR
ncbi:hypothetical protein [Pseudomonas sp. TH21]|uniref:hypothetical protein n=1 Tax=Pseudomonas sp. TH21 TaxID=2796387 RepID=UPI001F5B5E6B|nr:hypothetical protein [Pseudomonas sp. TH21]